jgi:hypothetical protein
MTDQLAPPPLPRPPDWFGRNWKWFVPFLVLVAAGVFAGVFAAILGVMKSSDAYQGAMARAGAAPAVTAALGTPVTPGFWVSGNIHVSGPSGQAQLEFPLKGPRGAATIYVEAHKSAGEWRYDTLVVQVTGTRQRIDLLAAKAGEKR